MTRPSAPCPERPNLHALVQRAVAAFEALTPEQQREHRAMQRRSWVIGETMLVHPDWSREKAEALYDAVLEGRRANAVRW